MYRFVDRQISQGFDGVELVPRIAYTNEPGMIPRVVAPMYVPALTQVRPETRLTTKNGNNGISQGQVGDNRIGDNEGADRYDMVGVRKRQEMISIPFQGVQR